MKHFAGKHCESLLHFCTLGFRVLKRERELPWRLMSGYCIEADDGKWSIEILRNRVVIVVDN